MKVKGKTKDNYKGKEEDKEINAKSIVDVKKKTQRKRKTRREVKDEKEKR